MLSTFKLLDLFLQLFQLFILLFLSFAFQFMISWLYNRTNGSALIVILFHFTSNVLGAVTHQLFTGTDWTRHYILFIALSFVLTGLFIVNTGSHMGIRANAERRLDLIQRKVQGARR